jgi:hypothetical protein
MWNIEKIRPLIAKDHQPLSKLGIGLMKLEVF